MSRALGFAAEELARDYLISKGLKWVESNYNCRWGEIDLIMLEGKGLIFVEVRSRTSDHFGGAAMSITPAKRNKIVKSASQYLSHKKIYDKQPVRFDVICFDGAKSEIQWIKNAFGLNY